MGHDLLDDYIAYQIVTGEDFKDRHGGGRGGCLGCVLLALVLPAGVAALLALL